MGRSESVHIALYEDANEVADDPPVMCLCTAGGIGSCSRQRLR